MNSFNSTYFSDELIKPDHPESSIDCAASLKLAMCTSYDSFLSCVILKNDHMSMYIDL